MANDVQISIIAVDAASNVLQKIGDNFGVLGQVAVTSITAAAGALGFLVEKGAEAEDVQTMFNAMLDNSPLKDYKSQLEDLAASLSKVTRFEDENIVSAETVLLRYNNLGKDVMPQAVKLTLDLATAMKTDAATAAQQLGRGLEDIAGGSLTALNRTKLFTKEQMDNAKAMAESGDAAGAQAYVLDILQSKIGGLAEKMGADFKGSIDIFNNTLQNLWENLGQELLPILTPVIQQFTKLVEDVTPSLTNMFNNFVVPAVSGAVSAFESFVKSIQDGSSPINGIIGNLINLGQSILTNVMPFLDLMSLWWTANGPSITVSAHQIFDTVIQLIQNLSAQIGPFVQERLAALGKWFVDNGPIIDAAIQNIANFFNAVLAPAVTDAWNLMQPILKLLGDLIGGLATTVLDVLAGNWDKAWSDMKSTVENLVPDILNTLGPLVKMIEFLYSISPSALGARLGSLLSAGTAASSGSYHNYGSLSGARASGGDVTAGNSYLVGERGPEVFSPSSSGMITPNSALGSGGMVVNISFPNLITAASPYDIQRILAPAMEQVVRKMQLEGRV